MMMKSQGGPRGPSLSGVLLNLLPAAFLFLLFAAVGIVHVTSRVMVVDAGYRLSRLQQEGRELTQANDKLKLELATLKSPLRLEKLAREQLGMAPPSAAAVVNVGASAHPAARRAPAETKPEAGHAPVAQRSAP
jgi:cell division protein FtsL